MSQKPAIRYHRNQLPWCEQLATLVHKGLKSEKIPVSLLLSFFEQLVHSSCSHLECYRVSPLRDSLLQPSDERDTILLILDRSVDLAPLFVHEYTYQV